MRSASAAIRRLDGFRHRPGLRDVTLALGFKAGGSVLAFAMLTLAARAMGLHEFGVFAFWFGVVSFASTALLLGQEAAIMVDWHRAVRAGGVRAGRAVLLRSTGLVLAAAALGGAGIAGTGGLSGAGWNFSVWAGAFAGLLAVLVYATHVARVVAGIAQGDGQLELIWRLFPTAGAAFALLAGRPFHAETFFACASCGVAVALVVQGLAIAGAVRGEPGKAVPPDTGSAAASLSIRDWAARSAWLWLGGLLDAANQYVEIFLIGLLLNPVDVGLYYAAARVAAIFSIVAAGLHVYASREIALHAAHPTGAGMRAALRLIGGVTALTALGGVLGIVVAGQALLSLFGSAFDAAYPPLVLLMVGVASVTLVGPVPAVLRLTGQESAYAGIVGGFALLRGLCVAAAAAGAGLTGAALASALCSVAFALTLRRTCRRRVGIDPSVLILIRKPEPAA